MVRALQPADPRLIGPYRLVGLLGSGGMGRVFLGISAGGRPVAVKVIRAELAADPDFRSRFSREVTAARRVNGLFTALVVDADVDAPLPWLATAFVPGLSLAQTVSDHGPLSARSVISLAAGLAEGLIAIHAAGVVHGDLKPSNVLLAEDGPRVIDFGISRAAGTAPLTHPGLVLGSPGYMSPEQAMGQPVGPLSDVFSLGAVLAFASTGRRPFGTGSSPVLLDRVINGSPDLDNVPAEVRRLAERCLAKDPAQRPNAAEVLADVGAGQSAPDWLPESIIRMFPKQIPASRIEGPSSLVSQTSQPTITLGSLPGDLGFTPSPAQADEESQPHHRPPSADKPPPGDPPPDDRPPDDLPQPADGQVPDDEVSDDQVSDDQPGPGDPSRPGDQQRSAEDPRPADPPGPGDQPRPGEGSGGKPTRRRVWRSVAAACVGAGILTASGAAGFAAGVAIRHPSATSRVAARGSGSATRPPSVSVSPAVSATASLAAFPRITHAYTYTKDAMVYLDIRYTDPGHRAKGFGFVGVKGSSWAEESHSFAKPASGIVMSGNVAYPFNEECGTARQSSSYVKVWIYDAAGARSKPVIVHLVCAG